MLVCGAGIDVIRWDMAHLLGLRIHHFVHSFISDVQAVVDVLWRYVSNAIRSIEWQCLRRRTLDARRVLAVIPSCCRLLCEAAKFPAHVEVERTRKDGFGGAVAMTGYLSSQSQFIAAAQFLDVIL